MWTSVVPVAAYMVTSNMSNMSLLTVPNFPSQCPRVRDEQARKQMAEGTYPRDGDTAKNIEGHRREVPIAVATTHLSRVDVKFITGGEIQDLPSVKNKGRSECLPRDLGIRVNS